MATVSLGTGRGGVVDQHKRLTQEAGLFAALFFVCLFVLSGSLIHSQSDKYMLVLPSNSARIYISPQIYMTDMADYAGGCF